MMTKFLFARQFDGSSLPFAGCWRDIRYKNKHKYAFVWVMCVLYEHIAFDWAGYHLTFLLICFIFIY